MISSERIDEIAESGLESIRACLGPNGTEDDVKRADMTLKLLRQGTSRMNGENQRVLTRLKIAKMGNISAEKIAAMWDEQSPARQVSSGSSGAKSLVAGS